MSMAGLIGIGILQALILLLAAPLYSVFRACYEQRSIRAKVRR